jgi:replicative DNA helicase
MQQNQGGANSSFKELKSITIEEAAKQSINYIKGRKSGDIRSLETPWQKFNSVGLGGLVWADIITIAGMSGSGKTAILNELETALVELNPNEEFEILSFNFEMLARNLISRKLSKKLEVSTRELHSGDEALSDDLYSQALEECKRLAGYKIHYVDIPGNVEQIKNTILTHYARMNGLTGHNKGLVVMLDHSLLVKNKQGNKERELLMDIMEMFNGLKKQLKAIFIIASQMNREIEQMERLQNKNMHFPRKRDIFGGDGLYMYSDIVLVTMNPEYMGLDAYGPYDWPVHNRLFWHFIKCREGEPVIAQMKNLLKYNKVEDFRVSNTSINLNEVTEEDE